MNRNSQGKLSLLIAGKLPWKHSTHHPPLYHPPHPAPLEKQAPNPKNTATASRDRISPLSLGSGLGPQKCEYCKGPNSDLVGNVKPAPGKSLANVLTVWFVRKAVSDKISERR